MPPSAFFSFRILIPSFVVRFGTRAVSLSQVDHFSDVTKTHVPRDGISAEESGRAYKQGGDLSNSVRSAEIQPRPGPIMSQPMTQSLTASLRGHLDSVPTEGGVISFTDKTGDDFLQDNLHRFNQIRNIVQQHLSNEEELYEKIQRALVTGERRIILPVAFLNKIHASFTRRLLADPFSIFPPMELAVGDVAKQAAAMGQNVPKAWVSARHHATAFDLRLGITGWLGPNGVTPRGLSARLANRLVCVEGIVTKCSLIHPRLTYGTFWVPELQRHVYRSYTDSISINPRMVDPVENVIHSNKDADGHSMELECGLSLYKDSQRLTIQEMPEMTPTGQLPHTIEIVLEHDLVECTKPGDRVRVWGVMRTLPLVGNKNIVTGYSRSLLVANNVELLNLDKRTPQVTPANVKVFKEIANREDTLDLIAASIAPGISGHQTVKRGLALQLIGGHMKEIEGDGSKLRGDIHVLLLGDPSCGKSQLLRFIMNLAPLSLGTTGRGSSAVGLTAAVVSDSETGERRLEAGAMVLADGGIVCIDEFDKMGFDDRVAVHEVMEQQRVSINKAGVTATLSARTSVLAAANPIYGLFDDSQPFNKQVNFPDSLLSRFDLIFLIRESASAEQDRRICSQVLSQLRIPPADSLLSAALVSGTSAGGGGAGKSRRAGGASSSANVLATLQPDVTAKNTLALRSSIAGTSKANVWTRMPAALTTRESATARAIQADKNKILTVDFLRKYILYCKAQPPPLLTEAATEDIADYYASLRQRIAGEGGGSHMGGDEGQRANHAKALPTPRLLEAVVRLATAHAKLKLKKSIDTEDVAAAKRLISYTMCGDVDADDVEAGSQEEELQQATRATKRRRLPRNADDQEAADLADSIRAMSINSGRKHARKTAAAAASSPSSKPTISISEDRVQELRSGIAWAEHKVDRQEWGTDELQRTVNKRLLHQRHKVFDHEEFEAGLKALEVANRLMVVGDTVYLV